MNHMLPALSLVFNLTKTQKVPGEIEAVGVKSAEDRLGQNVNKGQMTFIWQRRKVHRLGRTLRKGYVPLV